MSRIGSFDNQHSPAMSRLHSLHPLSCVSLPQEIPLRCKTHCCYRCGRRSVWTCCSLVPATLGLVSHETLKREILADNRFLQNTDPLDTSASLSWAAGASES